MAEAPSGVGLRLTPSMQLVSDGAGYLGSPKGRSIYVAVTPAYGFWEP